MKTFLCISLAMCTVLVTGCPYANPRTEVGYSWAGFKFHNSKDVKVQIRNAKYDPASQRFEVEELIIEDNASDVRRANVEQIKAQTEQVQAITAMITQQTQILASMAQSIMPWIKPATSTGITIPGVGGITTSTTPVPVPTTQPIHP